MKGVNEIAIVLAATAALVAGTPHHQHHHRHDLHRKDVPAKRAIANVVVPVVVPVYEFEGQQLTEQQVCDGLASKKFVFAPGTPNLPDCSQPLTTSTSSASPTPTPSPSTSSQEAQVLVQESASSSSSSSSKVATPSVPAAVPVSKSAAVAGIGSNANVGLDFPDGSLPCSHFPSDYGAIDVSWMDLGGWSGIQYVQNEGDVASHIDTAVAGGSGCANQPGSTAYCSYACPPGYQKAQWPTIQGSSAAAVSVGGLMCGPDNMLHLSNAALSTKLCIPGTGLVSVQNELSTNAAICRTDYPGK